MRKTNVMRILDSKKIFYKAYSYELEDNKIDGISVAKKINKSLDRVYKTIVCQSNKNKYVFLLPVNDEIDFKLAAKSVGEKSLSMVKSGDLKKLTGYIRGGCSPIAMKNKYKTIISDKVKYLDKIIVSAGEIGSQIEISLKDLSKLVDIEIANITKKDLA